MTTDLIFARNIFSPEDAAAMKSATALAISKAGGFLELSTFDECTIANHVIRLVQKGYTRSIDGRLDSESLAETAVVRFQADKRPDSVVTELAGPEPFLGGCKSNDMTGAAAESQRAQHRPSQRIDVSTSPSSSALNSGS